MTTQGVQDDAVLMAQAGAWLARLHGPNRTQEVEQGFRAWMNESAAHAAAFEHMTDTWEKSAQLRRRPVEHLASWELPGFRVRVSRAALATAAIVILAIVGTVFYLQNDAISTAVGEQRILTLDDGSRVYLNTATRAVVHYDNALRRVELDHGEALFEVAKHPERPFVVTAGDRQVRALGTSFVVRRDKHNVAVTLVEGEVVVAPTVQTTPNEAAVTLSPGQRVTFSSANSPRLDRPALNKMTAWQRGQVALDNTPLLDAVSEMNRYSRKPLVVDAQHIDAIRISGIFRAGESMNFARALVRSYGFKVVEEPNRIVVTGEPL